MYSRYSSYTEANASELVEAKQMLARTVYYKKL